MRCWGGALVGWGAVIGVGSVGWNCFSVPGGIRGGGGGGGAASAAAAAAAGLCAFVFAYVHGGDNGSGGGFDQTWGGCDCCCG